MQHITFTTIEPPQPFPHFRHIQSQFFLTPFCPMSSSRKSSASSRPSSSSRASGSATVSSSGPTWRSAPDNYSYQKNQKFSLAAASTEFQPKSFQPAPGETILKPVFSKDPALTPTIPKKQIPTAPVVVVSSRTMKASPPIIRSTVEAIDAEQMLKKFDEDAASESQL